ncbi:ABC transporter ATP-binding protein [Pontibacillus marinus]|uniref:ABC transporter ATP-binding protein n=1 Tax=Pontibacillus marinus BH030004 = DSM 16465 TaxID=1385511 RepID=A0A0A5G2K2_9BACI|nr:ABC transporter ATP-binding protein [Pontibacillus marinus]KGX86269.1 ABC transporter ATP-binding protein [Pontibacillus marinus BH030004 = DSM 16465]
MAELSLTGIAKSFEDTRVLEGISFDVHDAEFVSILGPSGSGKSTIFNLIGGLYQPDEGDIKLDGESIAGKRGSISYMPQSPSLFPWRTLLDNVMLGSEIVGQQDREASLQMIEKAGLGGYENAYPHQLSGGMKQRAAFIRSLLSPQPLICLDEPFSALDEFTRLEMQKWLLSLWSEYKRSVLFVTHNIEEALFLSDRVMVLSDRPARVKKEFKIPFERPRDESLLLTEEFLEWKKAIYNELRMIT